AAGRRMSVKPIESGCGRLECRSQQQRETQRENCCAARFHRRSCGGLEAQTVIRSREVLFSTPAIATNVGPVRLEIVSRSMMHSRVRRDHATHSPRVTMTFAWRHHGG